MKRRVFSALFIILIAIPLIVEGDKVFACSIGIIGILALKEILDLKKSHEPIPFVMSLIFYCCLIMIIYISPFEFSDLVGINYRFLSFLLIFYFLPCLYYNSKGKYSTKDAFYFLGVTLFLGIACHNVVMIRVRSLWLFLYIILVPILTDTFALLFGMLIGRHKLSPLISPKKTWEGSVLGTLCASVISIVFYWAFVGKMAVLPLIVLTVLLSIAGQLGDLLFSKVKRENEIKDFSDLIPGHGGILDRFDSIIFVSIVFTLLIQYI